MALRSRDEAMFFSGATMKRHELIALMAAMIAPKSNSPADAVVDARTILELIERQQLGEGSTNDDRS